MTEATSEHYALIAHPAEPRVLLLAESDIWALPSITGDEPQAIIAQIRALLGLETTVLGLIHQGAAADHRQGHAAEEPATPPSRVYALEPRAPDDWQLPAGTRWIASGELAALPLAAEEQRGVIESWLREIEADAVPAGRPLWARPGWRDAALAWVRERATECGYQLTAPPEQLKVSLWSAVYRAPAEPVALFFKAAAPTFAYEAAVTHVLSERLGAWVPRMIAADTARGWLLIEDGGSMLRERVHAQEGQRRFEEALRVLAAMQRASAVHVAELLGAGCPDYRLETLPERFGALIADREMLQVGQPGGVPEEEYAALAALGPELERMCARLAAFGIPTTLHHDDLGPGNVLEPPDGRLLLFDWGECGVAHPFCSLMIPLRWARLVLNYDEAALEHMREAYLAAWSAFGPPALLREGLVLAHRLGYLCRALTYARLQPHLERRLWGEYADVVPHLAATLPARCRAGRRCGVALSRAEHRAPPVYLTGLSGVGVSIFRCGALNQRNDVVILAAPEPDEIELSGRSCISRFTEHPAGGSSMTKVIVHTDEAPNPPGPYSQAVKSGGFVFVAGQGPIDPKTGQIVGTTIQEQTAQSLRNVAAILQAAGSSLDKAVSATFILAEPEDFAGMNEEWVKWFPTDGPARQGARLPITGIKISIAVIAEA